MNYEYVLNLFNQYGLEGLTIGFILLIIWNSQISFKYPRENKEKPK